MKLSISNYIDFRIDSEGLICEQRGVFRVNCVDCLDRTNIVQTALAKTVMDIQVCTIFVHFKLFRIRTLFLFYFTLLEK